MGGAGLSRARFPNAGRAPGAAAARRGPALGALAASLLPGADPFPGPGAVAVGRRLARNCGRPQCLELGAAFRAWVAGSLRWGNGSGRASGPGSGPVPPAAPGVRAQCRAGPAVVLVSFGADEGGCVCEQSSWNPCAVVSPRGGEAVGGPALPLTAQLLGPGREKSTRVGLMASEPLGP